jgi:hypothetical protein
MNLNTLQDLFASLIGFNTKWQNRISQTETPSRRYVRRLKTQHTKSISGHAAYIPSKINDPNFKYFSAAESAKTGYLENRMKFYKEMVKNESDGRICDGKEVGGKREGLTGEVSGSPKHGLQGSKLSVVGGQG